MPYNHISCEGTSIWDVSDFLYHFSNASKEMKKSEAALLKVMEDIQDPEVRKLYSAVHKKMVRIRKNWNRIEHERKVPSTDE